MKALLNNIYSKLFTLLPPDHYWGTKGGLKFNRETYKENIPTRFLNSYYTKMKDGTLQTSPG